MQIGQPASTPRCEMTCFVFPGAVRHRASRTGRKAGCVGMQEVIYPRSGSVDEPGALMRARRRACGRNGAAECEGPGAVQPRVTLFTDAVWHGLHAITWRRRLAVATGRALVQQPASSCRPVVLLRENAGVGLVTSEPAGTLWSWGPATMHGLQKPTPAMPTAL